MVIRLPCTYLSIFFAVLVRLCFFYCVANRCVYSAECDGCACRECHDWRARKPIPVIRILLAGGRTTNVEHSAIRIPLAGGRATQVEHFAIRILLAGGGTTTVERNTIRILLAGGRTTNVEHSAISQNTISGRNDRGPPRLGLTKLFRGLRVI